MNLHGSEDLMKTKVTVKLEGNSSFKHEGDSVILEGVSSIRLEGVSSVKVKGVSNLKLEGKSRVKMEAESCVRLGLDPCVKLEGGPSGDPSVDFKKGRKGKQNLSDKEAYDNMQDEKDEMGERCYQVEADTEEKQEKVSEMVRQPYKKRMREQRYDAEREEEFKRELANYTFHGTGSVGNRVFKWAEVSSLKAARDLFNKKKEAVQAIFFLGSFREGQNVALFCQSRVPPVFFQQVHYHVVEIRSRVEAAVAMKDKNGKLFHALLNISTPEEATEVDTMLCEYGLNADCITDISVTK